MRITYNDKLNKLLNPYLESLLKEKSSLEPETLTLFDLFMEDLDMGGRYGIFSEILEPRLKHAVRIPSDTTGAPSVPPIRPIIWTMPETHGYSF